ncbi:MAG: hypothetical protein L0G99_09110 [Propionibacteriales bacterium]|nr:hypothetical protein [Propionibacteriales bacterium]
MRVDPAEVSACASAVRDGAATWLSAHSTSVASGEGLSSLGDDRVGVALHGVLGSLSTRGAEYAQETGLCTSETGVVLHDMAYAYAMTFQDATRSAEQLAQCIARLGGV